MADKIFARLGELSDPVTAGIGVAVVVLLLGVGWWFFHRKDGFDDWYSNRKRLEEDEERKKTKKTVKAKTKKNDSQKENQPKSEKSESVSSAGKTEEEKEESEVPDKDGKKKKDKKRNSGSESKAETGDEKSKKTQSPTTDQKAESSPAVKKPEPKEQQSSREKLSLKKKNDTEGFTEVKPKKKGSPDKASQGSLKDEKDTVQKITMAQKPPEAKKTPHRNLDDMDIGKLLSDMVGTLDSVHVQFLKNYVENVSTKDKASVAAAAILAQEKNDLLKKLQSQTEKIRTLDENITQRKNETAGLTDQVKQLSEELQKQQADTELKKAKQEIAELKEKTEAANSEAAENRKKCDALKAEAYDLKKKVASAEEQNLLLEKKINEYATIVPSQNEVKDKYTNDINVLQQKITNLETALLKKMGTQSEVEELQKKNYVMELELLETKKLIATTEKLEENWEKLKPALTEQNHLKSENEAVYIQELEKDNAAYEKQITEWKEKHEKLMDEYLAMKKLVESINEEVRNFEEMQSNLKEKQALVDKQKEEIAKFLQAQEELNAETLGLRKQIAELKKQLASQTQNGDLGEEIVLQKATSLASAPPSSQSRKSADSDKLIEENKRLQEKNDELRQRNFKLAEMLDNISVQSSSNNPEVKVEAVPEESKVGKKGKDKKNKKDSKPEETPAPTHATTPASPDPTADANLVKTYRDALVAVKAQLEVVSEISEKRHERILELEGNKDNVNWPKLQQSSATAAAAKASPSVPAAVAAVSHTAGGSKPAAKKSSRGSEVGEEDWELVD